MKRLIYLLIAIAIHSQAQDSLLKKNSIHYRVDFGCGVRLMNNVTALNEELMANGFPQIPTKLAGFEFGVHVKRKKLGVGIFERVYWGNGEESNLREFSTSSIVGDLRITYSLLKNPRLGIEPLIGIGYQSFDFKLRNVESQPFSTALQNPPPTPLNLEYGSSLLYGGVSLNKRIRSQNNKYGQWNTYLGLQVLYNFCYGIWEINDNSVDAKDEPSGWEVKLTVSLESILFRR